MKDIMQSKTTAFWFDKTLEQNDYLEFFSTLASDNDLSLFNSSISRQQMLTVEDLVDGAKSFGVNTNGCQNGHGLKEDVTDLLLRNLLVRKLEYKGHNGNKIMIQYCDENAFPVMSIDLWEKGVSTLPAGLVTAESDDKVFIKNVMRQVIDFVFE